MRALISGSVIWGVGCIIPANLEPEPDSPVNSRPQIVGGTPEFQAIIPLQHSEPLTLKVTARDADVDDQLLARLRRDDGSWLDLLTLTTTSADGVERTGTFPSHTVCKDWGAMPNTSYSLAVFVTDTTFPADGLPSTDHSDFKAWPIVCQ